MSGLGEGQTHASRELAGGMYLKTGDPGRAGGGTYSGGTETEGTMAQYENIFGPAGRDIKQDNQRHKRHQRWHLPDALKGHNQYLTDRVDGLITDATNSPFTRNILPYVYLENPDQKLKWNVYSFDEGIASRVPYEAAARVLPQTKRSFAGYTVRQGLAIAMEHNFMVSAAGRENFKNQLTQLVGSIQLTNDLDVHVALLQAPSYQKHMNEKYYDNTKTTAQVCRQYLDLFGILQKVPNAMDILIEDAKSNLQTWGSQPPTFVLCNSALTSQLTMLPEKTNFVTNGPDGLKRLAEGPNLSSYRGLQIIPSRKFSMDAGTAPRDLLRRRVRVAEYYRIPWQADNVNRQFEFYDQSRDSMFTLNWKDLLKRSALQTAGPDPEVSDTSVRGLWKHDSLLSQKIPSFPISTFRVTPHQHGLSLTGRMAQYQVPGAEGALTCQFLRMTGFTYATDDAHYSRKRVMTFQEVIQGNKTVTLDNKRLIGVNGDALDTFQSHPDTATDKEVMLLPQQSELFGQGIFSDPLKEQDVACRFSREFDSLHQQGTRNDFMKQWLVVHLFDQMSKQFDEGPMGNSHLIASLSAQGSALANTPLSDLQSLVPNGVRPLFQSTESPQNIDAEYAFLRCREHVDTLGAILQGNLAAPALAYTENNSEWINMLMSADGALDTPGYLEVGATAYSRQQVINVLIELYDAAVLGESTGRRREIRGLITATPTAISTRGNFFNLTALAMTFTQSMANWTSFEDDPNLFFMWVLCFNWNTLTDAQISVIFEDVNKPCPQVTIDILKGFHVGAGGAGLLPAVLSLVHMFADFRGSAMSMKPTAAARLLRVVHSMQHKFDICNLPDARSDAHPSRGLTDITVAAGIAFNNYRRKLQRMAHQAHIDPNKRYKAEEVETLTASIRHNELVRACSTDNFRGHINFETNHNLAQINTGGFGNREWNTGYNRDSCIRDQFGGGSATTQNTRLDSQGRAGNAAQRALCAGKKFFENFYETFLHEMSEESSSVKEAHNLCLETSRSAGANISHFPNYHISRCTPLCESDRSRSASSQDEPTWMLQQLAGMMPLNTAVCKKMMGIHPLEHAVLMQSAEMLSGHTTANNADKMIHPSATVDGAANAGLGVNGYDECVRTPATVGMTWAADEYSTALMQAFMAMFNPNQLVRNKIIQHTFVPVHLQKQLMFAFARALETNQTMTPELATALLAVFPEATSHVPFCAAQACVNLKNTPLWADSETDWKKKLVEAVPWRNVPFSYNFEPAKRANETEAAKLARRADVLLWDAHQNKGAHGKEVGLWTCDRVPNFNHKMYPMRSFSVDCFADSQGTTPPAKPGNLHTGLRGAADSAAAFCRDVNNWETFWKHVVLVWVSRFFRASTRFVDNGAGMAVPRHDIGPASEDKYFMNGMHLMHGSRVPYFGTNPSTPEHVNEKCDIVILRPNIEHEMLGVIMGRGGTQELGATFWGQTELSCYDDAQHGIWGMSYKYHERAMVTNERNMIRAYDVAFDGYNGGMDQTCVDWEDPESLKQFRDSTYDRSKPFSGPSMMIMALPVSEASSHTWPNPIVYHADINSGYSPDPEKSQGAIPNIGDHVVFNHQMNKHCSHAVSDKFTEYMTKLQMTQWINADQSNRPAGESCIANEASSSPMAFQGSMRVLRNGSVVDDIKGSGHLGHSYVGIASVREGRGVLNPAAQHSMMRLV